MSITRTSALILIGLVIGIGIAAVIVMREIANRPASIDAAALPSITAENAAQLRQIGSLRVSEPVANLEFSPDGELLAVGKRKGTVVLWALIEARERIRFTEHGSLLIEGIAFHPNEQWIATGGYGSINDFYYVWDVESASSLSRRNDPGTVWDLAINSTGTILASANWNRSARIHPLNGAEIDEADAVVLRFEEEMHSVAFDPRPESTALAIGGWISTVQIVETPSGDLITWLPVRGNQIDEVTYSRDGTLIAAGGVAEDARGQAVAVLHVWETPPIVQDRRGTRVEGDYVERWVVELPGSDINGLAFTFDGSALIAAMSDGALRVISTADGSVLSELQLHPEFPLDALALHPSGAVAAISLGDEVVQFVGIPR